MKKGLKELFFGRPPYLSRRLLNQVRELLVTGLLQGSYPPEGAGSFLEEALALIVSFLDV